jgi:hypothetical protein
MTSDNSLRSAADAIPPTPALTLLSRFQHAKLFYYYYYFRFVQLIDVVDPVTGVLEVTSKNIFQQCIQTETSTGLAGSCTPQLSDGLITEHISSLHLSAVLLVSKHRSMTSTFRASVLLKSTTQNFDVYI